MSHAPAVRDIVVLYLRNWGYDGLFSDVCCCDLGELMECDEPCAGCQPGYRVLCTADCDCDDPGANGYHIVEERPAMWRRSRNEAQRYWMDRL